MASLYQLEKTATQKEQLAPKARRLVASATTPPPPFAEQRCTYENDMMKQDIAEDHEVKRAFQLFVAILKGYLFNCCQTSILGMSDLKALGEEDGLIHNVEYRYPGMLWLVIPWQSWRSRLGSHTLASRILGIIKERSCA